MYYRRDFPSLVATYQGLPLPEPNDVYSSVYEMAWPQILAFATACLGIYVTVLFIRWLKG